MTKKQLYWSLASIAILPIGLFILLMFGIRSDYAQEVGSLVREKHSLEQTIDSLHSVLAEADNDLQAVSSVRISRIIATAYNSHPWQTDDTPFITSSGSTVADGTLALSRDLIQAENALMHRMGFNPSGMYAYGDTVFVIYVKPMVVNDTMNRRYTNRADIWLDKQSVALKWGKRNVFIASRSDL